MGKGGINRKGECICMACGKDLQPNWDACPYCGTAVDHCLGCGKRLRPKWTSCPYCGVAVGQHICTNCGELLKPEWDICPFCNVPAGQTTENVPAGQTTEPNNPSDVMLVERTMGLFTDDSYEVKRSVVAWLVVLNGDLKGKDFRIYDGKNIIGSADDCDVVISNQSISAKHCVIRCERNSFNILNFLITDLDSANGTFVNGQGVQKYDLIDDDIIRLGEIEFKFKELN